jgi:hypothetical protein
MNNFRLIPLVLGTVLSMALLAPLPAHARLSDSKVCPKLSPEVSAPPGVQVPEVCYSNFNCTIGMRGDWLDITNRVTMSNSTPPTLEHAAANAEASIAARGTEIRASNACVPVSQRDREGYVAVLLEELRGAGGARVTAYRPAFAGMGTDFNSVDIEVRDGTHYLHPVQRAALSARVGEVKTIDLTGRGLLDLRIKMRPPTNNPITAKPITTRMPSAIAGVRSPATAQQMLAVQTLPVSIVSKSYDRLSLQVSFDRQGRISLADYLEFTVGDPAINRDLGWPLIEVRP